jgi:hypothetical protein
MWWWRAPLPPKATGRISPSRCKRGTDSSYRPLAGDGVRRGMPGRQAWGKVAGELLPWPCTSRWLELVPTLICLKESGAVVSSWCACGGWLAVGRRLLRLDGLAVRPSPLLVGKVVAQEDALLPRSGPIWTWLGFVVVRLWCWDGLAGDGGHQSVRQWRCGCRLQSIGLGGRRWRFLVEILVVAWSEPVAAEPAGAVDFLGSDAKGSSPRSHGLALQGNIRSSGSDDGGTAMYFSFLGASSQNRLWLWD